MESAYDAVLREMDVLRQQDATHPLLMALDAYLPTEDDSLFDSILDSAFDETNPSSTSFLKLSPLCLPVRVFQRTMLVMQAFQASKEKYVKNAPANDPWETRFLSYADVDLSTANTMGSKVDLDVNRWEQVKLQVMSDLMKKALNQDDAAKARLMQAPGNLKEDAVPHPFWGSPNNNIGLILDDLKKEFQADDKADGTADDTADDTTDDIGNKAGKRKLKRKR